MGRARAAAITVLIAALFAAAPAEASGVPPEPTWTLTLADAASAVSVQDDRFVYVAALRYPPRSYLGALVLRKYRLDGDPVWIRHWAFPNGIGVRDVDVGPDGQVAVVGTAACRVDSECSAWFVRLYSTHGDLLWSRAPGLHGKSGAGFVTGVVVNEDQVVVSGHCCAWGSTDGFVRAYDLSGGLRWHVDLGVPGARRFDEAANATAVGPGADLFVPGWVARGPEGLELAADHDACSGDSAPTAGFAGRTGSPIAPTRTPTPQRRWPRAAAGSPWRGTAVGGRGSAGRHGSRCSDDGELRWSDHFGRSRFFTSSPSVAIQPSGAVVVSGTVRDPTDPGFDATVRRYSPGGRLRWETALSDGNAFMFATDVAVVGSRSLLVTGYVAEDRSGEASGGYLWRL